MAYVGIAFKIKDDIDVRVKLHGPTDEFKADMLILAQEVEIGIGNPPIPKNDLLKLCHVVADQVAQKYCDGTNTVWTEVEIGNITTGICVGASATTEMDL